MGELQTIHFSDWKPLGRRLGIPAGVLTEIAADNRRAHDCLNDVIEQWLKGNYKGFEDNPPTWNNFASAIEPMEKKFAKDIREKHSKNYTPTHSAE